MLVSNLFRHLNKIPFYHRLRISVEINLNGWHGGAVGGIVLPHSSRVSRIGQVAFVHGALRRIQGVFLPHTQCSQDGLQTAATLTRIKHFISCNVGCFLNKWFQQVCVLQSLNSWLRPNIQSCREHVTKIVSQESISSLLLNLINFTSCSKSPYHRL